MRPMVLVDKELLVKLFGGPSGTVKSQTNACEHFNVSKEKTGKTCSVSQ